MNREPLPDDEPWLNAVPLRGQTFFANENRTGSILAAHHRSAFDAPNAGLFRACRDACIELAEKLSAGRSLLALSFPATHLDASDTAHAVAAGDLQKDVDRQNRLGECGSYRAFP